MNLLKQDVSGVRRKLAEAEAAIAPLEQELDEASLDAITSGDMTAAAMLAEQLRLAHERVGIAERAVQAAERQEAARLAEIRAKEARAKVRAIRAHLSTVERAAGDYQAAVGTMARTWNALRAAAGQATALLDPASQPFIELGEDRLRRFCELELCRVGFVPTPIGDMPDLPGASAGFTWLQGRVPCDLPPISQELARISAWVLGEAPKLDTPATPALRNTLTPGSEDWAAALHQRQNDAADMTTPKPRNPHPAGTVEHAEFAAVLAGIAEGTHA